MTDSTNVPKVWKLAGETRPYTIEWWRYAPLRTYWQPGRRYATNEIVRAPGQTGYAYQAANDGESAGRAPTWPKTLFATVQDGSVQWTAIAPSTSAALDPISSVTWLAVTTGITVAAVSNTIEEATCSIAGGTVDQVYRVRCTATTSSGKVYIGEFDVEIR